MQFDAESWDDIIGNEDCKDYLKRIVRLIHQGGKDAEPGSLPMNTYSAIISGSSRSGKSMMANFFIKCMLCKDFDLEALAPCGTCFFCLKKAERRFWNNYLFTIDSVVSTYSIDGANFKEPQMQETLRHIYQEDKHKVVFIDEFQKLVAANFADQLLIPMQENPTTMWLLTTTSRAGMGQALLNRLHKLQTKPPSNVNS
ncbi:hypothetical protein K2Y11_18050 [bacterium]|nr:hypothetical protein [bacterium]